MNHKRWRILLAPLGIAAAELVFAIVVFSTGMDLEGRILAVALTSGLLFLLLIPVTLTLIAIVNRSYPLVWWKFLAAFLIPSLPNMILQLNPATSLIPSLAPLFGPAQAHHLERPPEAFIFYGASYVILYALIGLVAFPAVRRGPAAAATVGTLAAAAILAFAALRSYGFVSF
jgi:hypothetical protein